MIHVVSDDITHTPEMHQLGSLNDAALTDNEASVNGCHHGYFRDNRQMTSGG